MQKKSSFSYHIDDTVFPPQISKYTLARVHAHEVVINMTKETEMKKYFMLIRIEHEILHLIEIAYTYVSSNLLVSLLAHYAI